MLNFPSCSSIFLSISLLLPQTKSKCMSWISINFTSNRIKLKCLIFSGVAEFCSHLHAKSMQVGGFLWKLQAAAWTCDNNNAGRWHHSQVTLLCVQKSIYSTFLQEYSISTWILKHTLNLQEMIQKTLCILLRSRDGKESSLIIRIMQPVWSYGNQLKWGSSY